MSLIDCDHKTPKAQEEGFPYVGIPQLKDGRITLDGARLITEDDFHHWRRKAAPSENDIILSRRCNPGETAYVSKEMNIALGQNLVLLRSNGEKIYPPFLRWATQGRFWWEQVNKFINVGAVFNSLKCADIPNFEIKLPPFDIQKRIANILGGLDKQIENNAQTNQTLEAIAQTLFKSWFVDFDPVKAKLSVLAAGGSAEEAERAAMCAISARDEASLNTLQTEQPEAYAELAGTAALFPSAMQDSELGEIPEGWEVSPLGSLIDIKHGFAFKGEYFSTEPTKNILLTPGNFRIGGGFKADKLKYYNGPIPENYLLSHNDLLVTMTDLSKAGDTLGYPALIPNSKYLCYLHNQRLGKVVFKNKLIGKEFIYQCLTTKVYRNEVLATATGSTVKHTSPKKILAYQVIHSKSGVERVFEQHCQKLTQTVSMNELNSLTLAKLRDTLLPKLLSGELTVTNTPPKANPPESDMLNAGSVPAEVIV